MRFLTTKNDSFILRGGRLSEYLRVVESPCSCHSIQNMSSDNEECEQSPVDLNNLPTEIFLKLLVLGDLGVGKSSLVRKYCHSDAAPEYKVSVDVSHSVKSVNINGLKVNLQLWDIPGHERFGGMTRVYYKVLFLLSSVCFISRGRKRETFLILNRNALASLQKLSKLCSSCAPSSKS